MGGLLRRQGKHPDINAAHMGLRARRRHKRRFSQRISLDSAGCALLCCNGIVSCAWLQLSAAHRPTPRSAGNCNRSRVMGSSLAPVHCRCWRGDVSSVHAGLGVLLWKALRVFLHAAPSAHVSQREFDDSLSLRWLGSAASLRPARFLRGSTMTLFSPTPMCLAFCRT